MHHADFSYQVCVSAAAAGRPEGADRLQLHPKRVGFTTGPGPVLGQPEDPQAEKHDHGSRPCAPVGSDIPSHRGHLQARETASTERRTRRTRR